jgi:hypothetical protein
MPRSVLELLNSWGPAIGCGRAKEAWQLAPLCFCGVFGGSGMHGFLKM